MEVGSSLVSVVAAVVVVSLVVVVVVDSIAATGLICLSDSSAVALWPVPAGWN